MPKELILESNKKTYPVQKLQETTWVSTRLKATLAKDQSFLNLSQ
jgi:hypothetical protein